MARKLRTFQTSQGFYDLAIAAPSMKAALDAWGANSNLFHQGFASEVDDPKVVAATLAKPGVVLRRPVGTNGPFSEQSELPTDIGLEKAHASPRKPQKAKAAESEKGRSESSSLSKTRRRCAPPPSLTRKSSASAKPKSAGNRPSPRRNARSGNVQSQRPRPPTTRPSGSMRRAADALMVERTDLEKREQAEESRWRDQRERLRDAVRKAGG